MMSATAIQQRFGARVRAFRKRRGLTQQGLADAVGKTIDTISNVERGINSTKIVTAAGIAEALGVDLRDLFDFPGLSAAERERRRRLDDLLELLETHDTETIDAVIAQAEILLRFKSKPDD